MRIVLLTDNDTQTNGEADTRIIGSRLAGKICKQFSPSKQTPNHPHIPSSMICLVKELEAQKQPVAPIRGATSCQFLRFPVSVASVSPAAGEGVSTDLRREAQAEKSGS